MRAFLKVLLTGFLAFMTLGIGSVGLCAVRGLARMGLEPSGYSVIFGLVILVAIAGAYTALMHIRSLWRSETVGESLPPHDS